MEIFSLSFSEAYRHKNHFLDLTPMLSNKFIQHSLKGSTWTKSSFLSCPSFPTSYSLLSQPYNSLPKVWNSISLQAMKQWLIYTKPLGWMDKEDRYKTQIEVTPKNRFTGNLEKRNPKNYIYKIRESGL